MDGALPELIRYMMHASGIDFATCLSGCEQQVPLQKEMLERAVLRFLKFFGGFEFDTDLVRG